MYINKSKVMHKQMYLMIYIYDVKYTIKRKGQCNTISFTYCISYCTCAYFVAVYIIQFTFSAQY